MKRVDIDSHFSFGVLGSLSEVEKLNKDSEHPMELALGLLTRDLESYHAYKGHASPVKATIVTVKFGKISSPHVEKLSLHTHKCP